VLAWLSDSGGMCSNAFLKTERNRNIVSLAANVAHLSLIISLLD
jgi:hypothetical protein